MNRTDILTAVREELAVAAPDLVPAADDRADLRHDLGVDSLAVLELVARLEYRFNLAVPDEAWPELTSVAAITDHLAGVLVAS